MTSHIVTIANPAEGMVARAEREIELGRLKNAKALLETARELLVSSGRPNGARRAARRLRDLEELRLMANERRLLRRR